MKLIPYTSPARQAFSSAGSVTCTVLIALLAMVLPCNAHAESVAVLLPDAESPQATQLRNAVLAEISAAGLEKSPGSDITLTELLAVNGCDSLTPDCAGAIRETVGADGVIWLSVDSSSAGQVMKLAWYRGTWPPDVVESVVPSDSRGPVIAARLLLRPDEGQVIVDTVNGEQVEIDGGDVQPADAVFSVSPGEHTVTVMREGFHNETREISVQSGDWQFVEVELHPRMPTVDDPSSPPPAWVATTGWALIGTGSAALIGAAITFALVGTTESELKTVTRRRPLTAGDLDEAQDLDERGQTLATATDVLFFSGLGLAALGTALVIVDLAGSESDSETQTDISLGVSPGGVSLRGRF